MAYVDGLRASLCVGDRFDRCVIVSVIAELDVKGGGVRVLPNEAQLRKAVTIQQVHGNPFVVAESAGPACIEFSVHRFGRCRALSFCSGRRGGFMECEVDLLKRQDVYDRRVGHAETGEEQGCVACCRGGEGRSAGVHDVSELVHDGHHKILSGTKGHRHFRGDHLRL